MVSVHIRVLCDVRSYQQSTVMSWDGHITYFSGMAPGVAGGSVVV